jgi:hypothetical protein
MGALGLALQWHWDSSHSGWGTFVLGKPPPARRGGTRKCLSVNGTLKGNTVRGIDPTGHVRALVSQTQQS